MGNYGPISDGEKFGRLTVLSFSHKDSRSRRHYLCKCDCGTVKKVQASLLRTGNTQSCGCLSRENKKNKRISDNHSEVTAVILGYKRHAETRNYEWNLTREFVEKTIKQNCFYCGSAPSNTKKTKNSLGQGMLYSGLDRKNNGLGYIKENVVPCCKKCNQAKGTMSVDEFKEWLLNAYNHLMADQWGVL